ncbi:MAG: ABC transporter substrate-binding protein [Clostridia bacterium]|nr:ABC transporter substrate-binding protein [Clostridia bacterium]
MIISMIFLSGCASTDRVSGVAGVQSPDSIRIRLPQEPPGLSPRDTYGTLLFNFLYEGLMVKTPQGTIQPGLAREWRASPDGLIYDFWLRPGATFSNGKPVTAEDVRASLYPFLSAQGIKVEAYEPDLIRVTLPDAGRDLLSLLARPETAIVSWEPGGFPAGTGKYRVSEWLKGDMMVLLKVSADSGPSRLEIVFQPDDFMAIEGFKRGDFQLVVGLGPEGVNKAWKDNYLRNFLQPGKEKKITCLGFNLHQPPWNQLYERQALASLIDNSRFQALLPGSQEVGGGPITGDARAAIPKIPSSQAREILQRALPPDKKITLSFRAGEEGELVARELAGQLGELGINVEISPLRSDVLGPAPTPRETSLFIDYFLPDNPEEFLFRLTAYPHPEYNALFNQLSTATSREQKEAILASIENLVAREVLVVPLYRKTELVLIQKGIDNLLHPYMPQ